MHARSTESKEIRESGKVIATTRDRMCVRLRKIVYNDDIIIFACVIFHAINAVYMRCIRKYYTTARALTNSTLYINIFRLKRLNEKVDPRIYITAYIIRYLS